MKIPQINKHPLTSETIDLITFTFDCEHAFPNFSETPTEEVKDAKPGWFARLMGWLFPSRSARRTNPPDVLGGDAGVEDQP